MLTQIAKYGLKESQHLEAQLTDHKVHARREAVSLCTWVADEARLVKILSHLHDALSWHV